MNFIALTRIKNEVELVKKSKNVELYYNDLYNFIVEIKPRQESLWGGGYFYFEINLPEDYPYSPPKVKCLSDIYHPNIFNDEISIDIIDKWAISFNLLSIVTEIEMLFEYVNDEKIIYKKIGDEYTYNYTTFEEMVRWHTKKFNLFRNISFSFFELLKQISIFLCHFFLLNLFY